MSDFHHPIPLTPDQLALLEAVKPRIRAEAATFDMDVVFADEECATPACIAGHLTALLNGVIPSPTIIGVERYFGMGNDCYHRTHPDTGELLTENMPLFHLVDGWDSDLQSEYEDTEEGSRERAEVAIVAIDRYIANTAAHFAEVNHG